MEGEAFLCWRFVFFFEGGIVFGERRLVVVITRGKQRGFEWMIFRQMRK